VEASSVENDYVNGFTATVQQWITHTGATPWLDNNVSNSIGTYTSLQSDRNYTFADTAIPYFANITKIELTVDTKTNSEFVGAKCYLSTGGAWSAGYNFGWWSDPSWYTDSLTVTSLFTTLAQINNCVMQINSSRSGASASVIVKYVHLTITYNSYAPSWHSVNTWKFDLLTRKWLPIESFLFDFLTRSWLSVSDWSLDLLTRDWQDVNQWNFDLLTRNWSDITSWNLDLLTRSWSEVATFNLDLLTRSWNSVSSWSFDLLTSSWHSIANWILHLNIFEVDKFYHSAPNVFWRLTDVFPQDTVLRSGVGQAFNATIESNLLYSKFNMMIEKGNPQGFLVSRLYSGNLTSRIYGINQTPAELLATSEPLPFTSLSNVSLQWITFSFNSTNQYSMIFNTTYCIDVEVYNATLINNSNSLYVASRMVGTHSGNLFSHQSGYWYYSKTTPTYDCLFYVLGYTPVSIADYTFYLIPILFLAILAGSVIILGVSRKD